MASLLQWAPDRTGGVFWFVVDQVATRWVEEPQTWYDLTAGQAREVILDEVLARDPFRLDEVDAAMRALERDAPCDGILDAWVWSHRAAFFDG